MAVEIFRNARSLTDPGLEDAVLTAGVDASVTTFSVDATTFLPSWSSGQQYRLLIDDELVIVTSVSSLDLTVTRAAESTTGAAHALGAKLYHVLTAAALANQSDVLGPSSSVDNAIARFDGTTGKLIQGYTSNGPTVSDTGGVVIAPAAGQSALTLTGATETTSQPVISATQTWNASGTTFTGLKLNVTNTASAAASLLIDLQVGGASVFAVGRDTGGSGVKVLNVSSANDYVKLNYSAIEWNTNAVGVMFKMAETLVSSGAALQVGALGSFSWQSTNRVDSGSADTILKRGGAAATVQLGFDLNGAAVSQTIQACNGITGTDRTGGNFTLASGKGTGAGAVSSVFIQTPTVLASGTTAQSLTTRLTIDSSGIKATGYLSSDGSAGVTAGPYTTITSITVKNGLVTALTGA